MHYAEFRGVARARICATNNKATQSLSHYQERTEIHPIESHFPIPALDTVRIVNPRPRSCARNTRDQQGVIDA